MDNGLQKSEFKQSSKYTCESGKTELNPRSRRHDVAGILMEIKDSKTKDFMKQCDREDLSRIRKLKYISLFRELQKIGVHISKINKECIDDVFFHIKNLNQKDSTKDTKWKMFKKICRFVKVPIDSNYRIKVKEAEPDILTSQEILKMLSCCQNFKYRLLIILLYESGCRIGELLTLRRQNIRFDEYGCVINVTGKTGFRSVRLVKSTPHLRSYLEMFQEEKLFEMTNEAVLKALKRLAGMSGIRKRVYSHLFRHTSATYWASHLTDRQMCLRFGWSKTSQMPARYAHLSMRDIDDKCVEVCRGIEVA